MEQDNSKKDFPKGSRIQSLMVPLTTMNMQEENPPSKNTEEALLSNVEASALGKVSESGEDEREVSDSTVVQPLSTTSPAMEKIFPEAVLMFDREAVSEREKIRKILEKKGIFDFVAKLLIPLEDMEGDDPLSLLKSHIVTRLQELDPTEFMYAHLEQTKKDLEQRVAQLTRELEQQECAERQEHRQSCRK